MAITPTVAGSLGGSPCVKTIFGTSVNLCQAQANLQAGLPATAPPPAGTTNTSSSLPPAGVVAGTGSATPSGFTGTTASTNNTGTPPPPPMAVPWYKKYKWPLIIGGAIIGTAIIIKIVRK